MKKFGHPRHTFHIAVTIRLPQRLGWLLTGIAIGHLLQVLLPGWPVSSVDGAAMVDRPSVLIGECRP